MVKPGDLYFNLGETLADHFGHNVVIARYSDMFTNEIRDYRLMCDTCDDPVGIATEVVSMA